MSNIRRKIIKRVKKQAMPYIKSALKTGANTVSEQLLIVADDLDQPIDEIMEKVGNALKCGLIAAGQEIARKQAKAR